MNGPERHDPPAPEATPSSAESPVPHEGAGDARGPLGLLGDRTFGLFFIGRMTAGIGVWVHSVVAAMLAYELTGSTLVVGVVGAAQFLPQLLLAPWTGARADRGKRTQQIIVGWWLSAAGSGGMALAIFVVGADEVPGGTPLVVASLLAGLGFVLSGPAMQAAVPSMVSAAELPAAMTLNSVPLTIARAGGPFLGALVATTAGPGVAFAVAAACCATFAIVVRLINMPPQEDVSDGEGSSVLAALRLVGRDRTLVLILLGVAAVGFAGDPAITLAPSLSYLLSSGQGLVGAIAGTFGAGTGAGFVVLALLGPASRSPWVGTLGLALISGGLATAGAMPTTWSVLTGFAIAGLGTSVALTSLTTQLQERVPESIRGRVMALWIMGHIGSRPLAGAANGFVADTVSVSAALFLSAGVVGGVAVLCRVPQTNGELS